MPSEITVLKYSVSDVQALIKADIEARGYTAGGEARLAIDLVENGEEPHKEILVICEVTRPPLSAVSSTKATDRPKPKRAASPKNPEQIARLQEGHARWLAEKEAAKLVANHTNGNGLNIEAQAVSEKPEELEEVVATADGPFHSGN